VISTAITYVHHRRCGLGRLCFLPSSRDSYVRISFSAFSCTNNYQVGFYRWCKIGSQRWSNGSREQCCNRRSVIDVPRTSNYSMMTIPRFSNAVQQSTPVSVGHDYIRSSPYDTATPAALVAGTSRRLPLRSCRYQIIIGYNVWCPPHYMGGLGY
jgi:hypothetical protein